MKFARFNHPGLSTLDADCAVCSAGYGNGAGHACHRCTDDFKAGMYVVLTLMAVCTIIVAALLAVYLVSETETITQVDEVRNVRTVRSVRIV